MIIATEKLLETIGFDKKDLKDKEKLEELRKKLKTINVEEMAKQLEIGEMTLSDIVEELSKPGRDPREDMPKPILRSDVLKLEDLKEGMLIWMLLLTFIFGAYISAILSDYFMNKTILFIIPLYLVMVIYLQFDSKC